MNSPLTYGMVPPVNREQLVKAHLSLVRFLVDRMVCQVPSYMTRDEINSSAMMGLVDAANRFDPGKGVLFKTFAERRIRGAILDEARRMDWFSRTLREKQSHLSDAVGRLEKELGRTPEEEEVAAAMGLALEEYRKVLGEVSHLGCISLQETLDGSEEGRTLIENLKDPKGKSPLEILEESEMAQILAERLDKLSEKERLVVSLYYYEELSQKEIAQVLELSEGRVSQLHSQALAKLRTGMIRQRKSGR